MVTAYLIIAVHCLLAIRRPLGGVSEIPKVFFLDAFPPPPTSPNPAPTAVTAYTPTPHGPLL